MSDFDLDDVLNLEENFYEEGFKEGQEHSTRQQHMEGKEFGYQTGFQRFLIVGYIRGLLQEWKKNPSPAILSHLQQLSDLIDGIDANNEDESVAKYEKNIGKARNKVRLIANLNQDQDKIAKMDELLKELGGEIKVSENVDDMW